MSNSALESSWISGGMILASITAWICSLLPAVMFEIVQHASFLIPFFEELSRFSSQGSALKLIITFQAKIYVWVAKGQKYRDTRGVKHVILHS